MEEKAIQLFLATISLFKRGSAAAWSLLLLCGRMLTGGRVEFVWQPGLRFHDSERNTSGPAWRICTFSTLPASNGKVLAQFFPDVRRGAPLSMKVLETRSKNIAANLPAEMLFGTQARLSTKCVGGQAGAQGHQVIHEDKIGPSSLCLGDFVAIGCFSSKSLDKPGNWDFSKRWERGKVSLLLLTFSHPSVVERWYYDSGKRMPRRTRRMARRTRKLKGWLRNSWFVFSRFKPETVSYLSGKSRVVVSAGCS